MSKYWAFWKRGWWAWLFMLCINLSFGVLVVPLAIAFHDNMRLYWLSAIAAWFIVGAPLCGWLFEKFAASSPRIIQPEQPTESLPEN
jgi:ABC-type glycerol-3-phosphate transport system permease component